MNILYFIGNGFDIALGAHTRYADFYKKVIKQPTNNGIFKSIDENTDDWANFEKQLCRVYTKSIKSKAAELKFLNDYYEFKNKFSKYLDKENKRILKRINNNRDEFINVMFESIYKSSNKLTGQAQEKIFSYFRQKDKHYHHDFILFNYTSLFNTLLAEARNIDAKNIIQIHGTYKKDMITGFYDESLIANKKILKNEEIATAIVKKKHIEIVDEILLDDIYKLIDSADIFVIIGMSIGESDSLWWDAIVRSAIKNKTMIYYIGHCPEECLELQTNKLIKYRNSIIGKLIKYSNLTTDEKKYIRENIIIETHNNNFNFPKH